MGCNCARDLTKIVANQKIQAKNKFILKIHIPNTYKIRILFHISDNDKEGIINLFNYIFFTSNPGNELDANFLSIYNQQTKSFDYYIQRLAGYELENEVNPNKGKMWNLYLNNSKANWTFLCNNNRIISVKDEMELKYEGESNNHSTNVFTTQ